MNSSNGSVDFGSYPETCHYYRYYRGLSSYRLIYACSPANWISLFFFVVHTYLFSLSISLFPTLHFFTHTAFINHKYCSCNNLPVWMLHQTKKCICTKKKITCGIIKEHSLHCKKSSNVALKILYAEGLQGIRKLARCGVTEQGGTSQQEKKMRYSYRA